MEIDPDSDSETSRTSPGKLSLDSSKVNGLADARRPHYDGGMCWWIVCSLACSAPSAMPVWTPVEVRTEDGALLRGKRCASAGAPVVLLHGLFACCHQFDLDEDGSPSLASFLAERGYDVWLFNFRGVGRGELESLLPAGRTGWSADDHAVQDLPAVLAHVGATTHERPFVVAHSLGGMVLAAYLAGAAASPTSSGGAGIAIDRELAHTRNQSLRGAVLLSTPLRVRWEPGEEPRLLVRLAAVGRSSAIHLLPQRLRAGRLNRLERDEAPRFVRRVLDRVEGFLEEEIPEDEWLALLFGGATRERALLLLKKLRGGVLSDSSRPLLSQLAHSAEVGSWLSQPDPAGCRMDYAEHYGNITAALLVVVGAQDRVAAPGTLRRVIEELRGSTDKAYIEISGYGHSDVTLGRDAHRDVYPQLAEWMALRSAD